MIKTILGLIVCISSAASAAGNLLVLDAEQAAHIGVEAILPEPVSSIPLLRAPGRIVLPPAREFAVTTFQSGIITGVYTTLGARVAKGQMLAELNSLSLLDAERSLVDAHAAMVVAEARVRRDDILWREGIIAQIRAQETRSDYERAQATLRAAEQTLLGSGVSPPEIIRIKSGKPINGLYHVMAPADGVVLERMAIVGQRVDALSPLFRIGQLDELWMEVDMPQERLSEAKIGDSVTTEDPEAHARIIEIGQSVDPKSQSALVRAKVDRGADKLKPGMHVNVQLMHRSNDEIFRVPVAAIFMHEGKSYVFVRQDTGFEAREVAIAGQEAYHAVLHEGLHKGEMVVIQGVAALKSAWLAGNDPQPQDE